MSAIQKVEIVTPAPLSEEALRRIGRWLVGWNLRTLVVFWFVATWFPELGLTYWALLLPVYIASWLFRTGDIRFIPEKNLWRSRSTTVDYDKGTVSSVDTLTELAKPKASIKL